MIIISGINWKEKLLQISIDNEQLICPMEVQYDDFYFQYRNQWLKVSDYAHRKLLPEILEHKSNIYPKRESITQHEFEDICKKVLSKEPDIVDIWFSGTGTVHFYFKTNSGGTRQCATIYYGKRGFITHEGYKSETQNIRGKAIAYEIANKIHLAMYE